jgi:histidyl-tRNA synthetase
MALQPVRGTRDILPDEAAHHRYITETAREISARYGYAEMATPVFEMTEVFQRTLGDTTDVVTKEMYTFEDKGGTSITLRPEGTAGVARALISSGLSQHLPLRYYYEGPMFRRERPQKGRYRQFHQIGVELLGEPGPAADVEVIAVAAHILDVLGVRSKTVLELNSLGDAESRARYRAVLVEYLRSHADSLSHDSQVRLERNPLRILDSKDEGDRAIVKAAPVFADSFGDAARAFFDAL